MAFVPLLPALSYMFVVALAFGIYDHFVHLTGWNILVLLCITLASIAVDHTAGLFGAKYGGAHTKSLGWGIVGAFVGLFIFPAFGSFIGLFLGVLGAELLYRSHHVKALKAAGGALLGSFVGVVINIFLAFLFLGLFVFLAL